MRTEKLVLRNRLLPMAVAVMGMIMQVAHADPITFTITGHIIFVDDPRLRDNNLVTKFFDVMSSEEKKDGLARLRSREGRTKVTMYFDSVEYPFKQLPEGNKELESRLDT